MKAQSRLYKTREEKTMLFDTIFNTLDIVKELIAYAADAGLNLVSVIENIFASFPMPL